MVNVYFQIKLIFLRRIFFKDIKKCLYFKFIYIEKFLKIIVYLYLNV